MRIPIELTRLESVRIDDQQSALGIVPLTRPGVPSGVKGVDGELTGSSQVGGRGETGGFVQDRLEVQSQVEMVNKKKVSIERTTDPTVIPLTKAVTTP
jgi:hypothetical protein